MTQTKLELDEIETLTHLVRARAVELGPFQGLYKNILSKLNKMFDEEYAMQREKRKEVQKEQKVDLVAELKQHLATTPKEQLEREWKELEPWGNIGPTVQEFLYGKQPEVDLEKDVESWFFEEISPKINIEHTMYYYFQECARRYYELGLNAKEENK